MAAFYRRIPVGHVEAGLRSGDMALPFPEEMNRVLTDRIAAWWFAPTELARENLLGEGAGPGGIHVTGNTVIDALLMTAERTAVPTDPSMSALIGGEPFILLTAHRRESWGEPLERICSSLLEIIERCPGHGALVPMHRNPVVRDAMRRMLGGIPGVILCDPLSYPDFVWALKKCRLIMSDSGGVQEEATALRKPVLILRDVTERPEAIESGCGVLVGTDPNRIVGEAFKLLNAHDDADGLAAGRLENPFGDGKASARIADVLLEEL
jgi:UDP-N-acetylglucosamine 2-epimerase (non-hydrolysing)